MKIEDQTKGKIIEKERKGVEGKIIFYLGKKDYRKETVWLPIPRYRDTATGFPSVVI